MQSMIARHSSRPRRTPNVPHPTVPRAGFTLVELLTVVVILGILMAFLLPAIQNARTAARVAQVTADLSKLEDGISSFKAKFGGMEPPSSITLHEEGGAWDARNRAILRRMFPQFNFNLDRDFDGNGTEGESGVSVSLSPSECLVFFLGGMRDSSSGALRGFSTNPANPFAEGGNRVGPFFEFDPDRLMDASPGNGFPEYRDPIPGQTAPYLYFSSYEGRGYDAAEVAASPLTFIYRLPGEDANLNNTLDSGEDANSNSNLDVGPPYKEQSYQLISPGFDFDYGVGGTYESRLADFLNSTDRQAEVDNITNFSNGMLAP